MKPEQLKQKRLDLGLTQKQLADGVGNNLHVQTISTIERGVKVPSPRLLKDIKEY